MNTRFSSHKQKNERTAQRRLPAKSSGRRLRSSSYSMFLTAVVTACVVILNFLVSELPAQYTQFDVSAQKLFTLRPQTEELASALDKDVTLYYIVQDNSRDDTVSRLLERYDGLSSHISVVEKDPVLSPNFTSQYTSQTLPDNSVIAVCGENSRVVSYDDMYEQEFNYNYYSYETTGFDAEGQITSALAAVTADDVPILYRLTGHGEQQPDETAGSMIEKQNVTMQDLNLMTAGKVPEDADCLLIFSPSSDLNAAEADRILDYLRTGGNAVVITGYQEQEMPNLDSVLEWYGIHRTDGVVIEGDDSRYIQVPYYLVPEIKNTDYTADMADGSSYVLFAAAQGLTTDEDLRDGLTVTELLSTSDSAYSKTNVEQMSTYLKEDGDIDGPFSLGLVAHEEAELTDELLAEVAKGEEMSGLDTNLPAVPGVIAQSEGGDAGDSKDAAKTGAQEDMTETADGAAGAETDEAASGGEGETDAGNEAEGETENAAAPQTVQTNLAVFSSPTILDPSADQMVSGGNFKLFQNVLGSFCGNETNVSIPSRSLALDYLTVTSQAGSMWSIIVTGIIPGAFLLCGLFIWYRRRRQ